MTLPPIRGFRAVFTTLGVLYVAMASSALVRGVSMLRDFGVSESDLASGVLSDFFLFFYELMAFLGVLMVVVGWATTERRAQVAVAGTFSVANVFFALRDVQTSDSAWGNHLYRGDATLMFVVIDVALALAFGALAVAGLRGMRGPARVA